MGDLKLKQKQVLCSKKHCGSVAQAIIVNGEDKYPCCYDCIGEDLQELIENSDFATIDWDGKFLKIT